MMGGEEKQGEKSCNRKGMGGQGLHQQEGVMAQSDATAERKKRGQKFDPRVKKKNTPPLTESNPEEQKSMDPRFTFD